VDCKFENLEGWGTSGGSDFIHVSDSAATRIHNVQFENISNGDGYSPSWTNTLNDTVTGTTFIALSYPDITSYTILPGYWQQNVSPNTALVNPGADIIGGSGLFSGTGTTYTGWNTYLAGLTSGQVTYSLNISDPPNNPTISGGTSSQDITIGANSAPQGSAAGVQTGASYGMTAGKTYNVSYQARVISGSINTVLPYVGVGGVSNCTPPFQYVTITSSWQTYSFQCTAFSTESVGVLIQAVMSTAGSLTGDVRVGDIQIQPYFGGVPNAIPIWVTAQTLGSATPVQIINAIGVAAVANATNTTNINNGAVPASVNFAGTNSSSQIVQNTIPMLVGWGNSVGTVSGTTYYCMPSSSSVNGNCSGNSWVPIPLPQAVKFTSCQVYEICTTGTCASFGIMKYHTGTSSGPTAICTPTAGTGYVTCTNSSVNLSFAAGDGFGVSATPGQASSAEAYIRISCSLQ
jgi:hypothetical protein